MPSCIAGTATFVVTNTGATTTAPYPYEIRDNTNTIVATGTISLASGGSTTITFTGVPGQTYTLIIYNPAGTEVARSTANCLTATFTPSATSTAGVPATSTAAVFIVDPAITKLADVNLALPGEVVTFTLTATNRGTAAATNVVVDDQIPNQYFTVLSASTTKGTYTITGNNVQFVIGTLNPGEVVVMRIVTRVRADAPVPVDAINVANLTDGLRNVRTASATVRITRGSLPATGEHPESRLPLIILLTGGAVLAIATMTLVRRRRKA